jgi:hypothetical protein
VAQRSRRSGIESRVQAFPDRAGVFVPVAQAVEHAIENVVFGVTGAECVFAPDQLRDDLFDGALEVDRRITGHQIEVVRQSECFGGLYLDINDETQLIL